MRREFTINVASTSAEEEIAVLQQTDGPHPFVAWHGITGVNQFWFWDVLWPLGAVYLAGLPGHGVLQPRPPEHYWRWTQQHFIETGIATLRALANGQRATIIGHSTGGLIALGIAHQAPELVARLILVSPVVWSDLRGIVRLWQQFADTPQLLTRVIGASLGAGRKHHLAFLLALNAFIADRRGFYSNPKVFYAVGRGYEQMQHTDLHGIAGTTRVLKSADARPMILRQPTHIPTLVIHGERDPIVPFEQGRWVAETLPNATLCALPGAGHLPYGEQELLVNEHVEQWLQQHPLPYVSG